METEGNGLAAIGAELAQLETTAPAVVHHDVDPLSETCGTCHFRRLAKDLTGMCRRRPPSAHLITAPGPMPNSVQIQTMGVYPPVGANDPACGEWNAKANA